MEGKSLTSVSYSDIYHPARVRTKRITSQINRLVDGRFQICVSSIGKVVPHTIQQSEIKIACFPIIVILLFLFHIGANYQLHSSTNTVFFRIKMA
jgi:hypothetical protein